ncbi:hypothetical protein J6590_076119 [Homalodisca vitripennis]|nr:hypothetical protein J6590_076119 [Homalodisca vitripennis]
MDGFLYRRWIHPLKTTHTSPKRYLRINAQAVRICSQNQSSPGVCMWQSPLNRSGFEVIGATINFPGGFSKIDWRHMFDSDNRNKRYRYFHRK